MRIPHLLSMATTGANRSNLGVVSDKRTRCWAGNRNHVVRRQRSAISRTAELHDLHHALDASRTAPRRRLRPADGIEQSLPKAGAAGPTNL